MDTDAAETCDRPKPLYLFEVADLLDHVVQRARCSPKPLIVGLDGRSGVGKSTLARVLADSLHTAVIEGDDFYAGGTELRADTAESRAKACIDWTRQRAVLEAFAGGRVAVWRSFDWDAFDGRLRDEPSMLEPRPIVILEGVYSARPELADLLDLCVVLTAPDEVRIARLAAREGAIGPWETQWHDAEEYYFEHIMPLSRFDVVMASGHDDTGCPL